jgi:hypothetical protein
VPVVTLLTDFGTADYYLAAVKGVLLSRAPGSALVDITHDVQPGDIEAGAFLLDAAVRSFPPACVHLVIVDPGVGSGRRILAVLRAGSWFVAPDNGVLGSALEGGVIHSVEAGRIFLPAQGNTFHGRDRFAPVAAHLAGGGLLDELGPRIEDAVRLDLPRPRLAAAAARGRVAHVDRFGNLVTDLPVDWMRDRVVAAVGLAGRRVRLAARHYAEIPAGEPAWLAGSLGTVELSLRGESLARCWGIERGEPVEVAFR